MELIYLALSSVDMSKMRVAARVSQGGHNIPVADIERRFPRSLYNLLYLFSQKVDYCNCFMSVGNTPIQMQTADQRRVVNEAFYQQLATEARQ